MAPTNSDMDEIWAILAQEGRENLSIVEESLLKLEKKPDNRDEIAALFRALHTFKGTVRMMDFSITEGLAHHAEDLVSLVRDEGVILDEEMIDLLLVAMDRMRSLLEHILTYHTDVEPEEVTLISNKLESMVKRKKDFKEGQETPSIIDNFSPALPIETIIEEELPSPIEVPLSVMEYDFPDENESVVLADAENEAFQEAIIFEPVNLADNPEYVQIFLDVALPELGLLKTALNEVQKTVPDALQPDLLKQIDEPLETLQIASERMGYQQINSLLETISQIVNSAHPSLDQTEINSLIDLEAQLTLAFSKIQSVSKPVLSAEVEDIKLDFLYHQGYTQRLNTDLDQLDVIIGKFNLEDQFIAVQNTEYQKTITEELNRVLGSLYHICIDDHLEKAAQLTLTLEDLNIRINQGEIPVTSSFIEILKTYTTQLREALGNPGADKFILSLTFDAMIGLTQQMIKLTSRNPILQVTRNFINQLDIDPEFKKIMTNENLAEISQSIRAGFNLYTLCANVEEDEEIGLKFQKWVSSGSIIPITNIMNRTNNQCLLVFLIAASYDINTIRNILNQMDPEEKFFSISKCAILVDNSPEKQKTNWYENLEVQQPILQSNVAMAIENLPTEVIGELTEMVGGLVADQSTLNRVISRMAEKNTTEIIMRLLKTTLSGHNLGTDIFEKIHNDLQSYWAPWEMDISALTQTNVKLNAGFIQLQEKTRSLGLRPATDLLNPLTQIAQSLAFRQGKQVTMTCQGGDSELDQRTLSLLSETVQNLIAFCVNESIEMPDQRGQSGKNSTGQIRVTVIRAENHTQVVIEDDGNGLNQDKILAHGRQLGWLDPEDGRNDLIAWLFNPEFYFQGNAMINLAALNKALQSNKGKIILVDNPGRGLQFIVNLQLDVAVVDGMVVRVGEIRYIIPVYAIQRIIQPSIDNLINTAADGGGRLLNLEGKVYPVRKFESKTEKKSGSGDQHQPKLLVIIEKQPQSVALDVDEIIGRQSVLVRPLAGDLMNNHNTIGCALLGEGEIGMVLDLDNL